MAPALRLLGAAAAAPAAATGPAPTGFVDVSAGARALVVGAGSPDADGTYSCARSICFQEGPRGHGAYEIKWYYEAFDSTPAQAGQLWPSGWYMEQSESRIGIYYADSGNATHLPLGAWRVWSGEMSAPGEEPPPVVAQVDSVALQAPMDTATENIRRPGREHHTTNRRFLSPVLLGSAAFSFLMFLCLIMLMRRQSPHFSRREVGHLNLVQGDAKEDDGTEPE